MNIYTPKCNFKRSGHQRHFIYVMHLHAEKLIIRYVFLYHTYNSRKLVTQVIKKVLGIPHSHATAHSIVLGSRIFLNALLHG